MAEKILLVDDDPNILSGFRRNLRNRFAVETANGADAALEILKNDHDFAVVVSDYRMPGMNGVEFLSRILVEQPDCVRVLLTGEADTKAASTAVNHGQIYRFLMKPCPALTLERALTESLHHHHLITAQNSLLERTLRGSTEVLTEILTLVQPSVFGRSNRIYRRIVDILGLLDVPNKWEFEIAAMVSQIGCVTTPADILLKVERGQELSEVEQEIYLSQLSSGARFLEKIPRLENVAQIIAKQGHPPTPIPAWQAIEKVDRVILGSNLLGLGTQMETARARGLSRSAMMLELRSSGYPQALMNIVETLLSAEQQQIHTIRSGELRCGMMLESDVFADSGLLLLAKGQWLSPTLFECLRRHYEYSGKEEMVQVKKPPDQPDGSSVESPHR